MIKEKKKVKKKKELTLTQEILGYVKTAGISFLAAAIFTVLLSFHSRSEMIKNLYATKENRTKIECQVARQIVEHSDLTSSLNTKNFSICMQVGNLYELAGDYLKAEYAYNLAYEKAPFCIYSAHLKLFTILIERNKIQDAVKILESVQDTNNLRLVRFKTRSYIILGDKYYSEGMFLKAADAYEKAYYYYSHLTKKDKIIKESIKNRLVNSYLEAASVIVKNGYNTDAVRFLKKALNYDPKNLNIQYRLAIVYSDLDPLIALDYFDPLIAKIPQYIDYSVYTKTLMKAANIMDIQGNSIRAKYYRYKVHSFDLYVNRKVVYKDEIEIELVSLNIKKSFFTYKIISKYKLKNISAQTISRLAADFILMQNDKEKEKKSILCASKNEPIVLNGGESDIINITFGNKIFTRKDLEKYHIDVYLYKDAKFKTLVDSIQIPIN